VHGHVAARLHSARPADLPRSEDPAAGGAPDGPPVDEVEAAIAEVAQDNQTDGYRMVCALVARKLGARGQPQTRAARDARDARAAPDPAPPTPGPPPPARLLRCRPTQRALAPGPHVGVARRARLALRDGRDRPLHPRDRRLAPRAALPCQRGDGPRRARDRRPRHRARDAGHRQRLGVHRARSSSSYRAWASRTAAAASATPRASLHRVLVLTLKERCVLLRGFETLDEAREVIGAQIDSCHYRPHSRLDYRTPGEVAQTWDDALWETTTHAA
jgi:hypothetical protein